MILSLRATFMATFVYMQATRLPYTSIQQLQISTLCVASSLPQENIFWDGFPRFANLVSWVYGLVSGAGKVHQNILENFVLHILCEQFEGLPLHHQWPSVMFQHDPSKVYKDKDEWVWSHYLPNMTQWEWIRQDWQLGSFTIYALPPKG